MGRSSAELVPGETRPLALRWTLYDGLRMPFFDVNSAQNWEEFRRAFSAAGRSRGRMSSTPTWMGTSATRQPGKVPVRAAGDGSLPVSGADDGHEWVSFIPFDKLPQHLQSALGDHRHGQRPNLAGRLTPIRSPAWSGKRRGRTARIYHVLESGQTIFRRRTCWSLQTDVHSEGRTVRG
jgi:penicillin amidase